MRFSDFSFKAKILTLLSLPLIGFLWVSSSLIYQNIATVSSMSELARLTQLSTVFSELVHEIQRERGMTAGYLGSKGGKFGDKLKTQRKQTTAKLNAREQYLDANSFGHRKINNLNHEIAQDLSRLENLRKQIDQQTINLGSALAFYTALNKKLLSVSEIISHLSEDADISRGVIAYYNFLQGKERAGIERA